MPSQNSVVVGGTRRIVIREWRDAPPRHRDTGPSIELVTYVIKERSLGRALALAAAPATECHPAASVRMRILIAYGHDDGREVNLICT